MTRRRFRVRTDRPIDGYVGSSALALVAAQAQDLEVRELIQTTHAQRNDVVDRELLGGMWHSVVARTDVPVARGCVGRLPVRAAGDTECRSRELRRLPSRGLGHALADAWDIATDR